MKAREQSWYLAIGVAILIVIGVLLWIFWKIPASPSATVSVPAYFTNGALNSQTVSVAGNKDYVLSPIETISNGTQFTLNEPYSSAVGDYNTKMRTNGWIAVGGSTGGSSYTIFKMAQGSKVMFVRLEPSSRNAQETLVTIIPVNVLR